MKDDTGLERYLKRYGKIDWDKNDPYDFLEFDEGMEFIDNADYADDTMVYYGNKKEWCILWFNANADDYKSAYEFYWFNDKKFADDAWAKGVELACDENEKVCGKRVKSITDESLSFLYQ